MVSISKNKVNSDQVINDLLKKRWSPRAFSDKKIPQEKLLKVFKSGSQVASSYNEQPWAFILATKGDSSYEKLYDCLVEFNKKWVTTGHYLVAAFSKKYFGNKEKGINLHRFYDTGAFMSVASLQATALDLYVHQMAGFSRDKISSNFHIPAEYEPITMFVIGEIGDKNILPENLKKSENSTSPRKEIDEFLFKDEWGKSF